MRHASVAQWIERGPSNPEVAGSSPVGGATDPHPDERYCAHSRVRRADAERGADQPSSSGSPALCALNAPQWERWAGRVAGPQSTEQSPR